MGENSRKSQPFGGEPVNEKNIQKKIADTNRRKILKITQNKPDDLF